MFGGAQSASNYLKGLSGLANGMVLTADNTQPSGMKWAAGGGGGSVTSVTATSPLFSSGGATPNLTAQVASGSQAGVLSASDWTAFNSKQAAGSYLTALTGDVAASGPGSVPAVIASAVNRRYVDFLDGDDTNGTGTATKPWKTLNHAYAQITTASVNRPFTIYLSGGNNDSDTAITAKPNINLYAEYLLQISPAFTVSGVVGNDGCTFSNIIFVGQFTWVRNDGTAMGLALNNCQFFAGPNVQQQGGGGLFTNCFNCTFVNSQFLCNSGGVFVGCTFLGTTTFDDMTNAAYLELLGGYNSSAISVSGGVELYMSGMNHDVPFGASITTHTTANGSPVIQADSGSITPIVTGTFTLNPLSNSQYEAYSPATAGNWSPVPSKVNGALDTLAAKLAAPYQYAQIRFVDGVNGLDTNSGSPVAPFKTIQAALTSLGGSATASDVKKPISVYVQGGAYDEALTIPNGRICNLIAMGTVILGDGATANWGSTTPRSVTFTANNADVHGSDVKPALSIFGLPGADATSTFIMESGCFRISGNLNVTGDGLTNSVSLHSVRVDGTLTHTTAALTNWQCYRTLINGAVTTTGNLVLERAYDSRFNALVSVNAYNMTMNCNFAAGMTVQSVQQNLLPNGMFCTNFAGAFTGVALSLRLDEVSNGYFVGNGATLAGGATKVVLAQSDSGTTTNRPAGTLKAGYRYFDTTLTKPIWAKGDGTWVDATGAAV